MKGLSGKIFLVTGGAGAIGAAILRRFAEEGAKLGVADRNAAGARRLAEELQAAYITGQVISVSGGLTMAG